MPALRGGGSAPRQASGSPVKLAQFSKRCISCHEPKACGLFPRLGPAIEADCVSCHMPAQEVKSTIFQGGGGAVHPTMTDHRIAVDRAASERFLKRPQLHRHVL